MLGWAPPAYGLLERVRPPLASYEEWRSGREMRNLKVTNRIRSSGDTDLDCGSYEKTLDEVEAGVMWGPYYTVDELPTKSVSLAPRSGIWECHGDATGMRTNMTYLLI